MAEAATSATSASLIRRAFVLEGLTVAWNTVEAAVALVAGVVAGSIALVGFGLDSLIEIFAASVFIWQLRGVSEDRERTALRLIAVAQCSSGTAACSDAVTA